MIDVSVEVNGQPVKPAGLNSILEAAVINSVKDTLIRQVASMRCDEHGELAKLTLTGSNPDHLKFKVSGCCQRFIESVADQLK